MINALVSHAHRHPCSCRHLGRVSSRRRWRCRRGDVNDSVLGNNVGPAEGAVGGGVEPGVDAVDVEGVEAGRQPPQPLPFTELAEAHGALARHRRLLGLLVVVPERWYPAYRRFLKPATAMLQSRGVDDVAVVVGDVVELVVAP